MLNQIYNAKHTHVQLKYNVSNEEKKGESEKENCTISKRENTFLSFFHPITIEKTERESKHAPKYNSAILFRIRLALKHFIHAIFF